MIRAIPVPAQEHGYSKFSSKVIGSEESLAGFMRDITENQPHHWNSPEDFLNPLKSAKIDFNREVIVLIRHTEGSGSVQVNFAAPERADEKIICRITRNAPQMGTMDMAYYCFALIIPRAGIGEVEVQISGRPPQRIPLVQD